MSNLKIFIMEKLNLIKGAIVLSEMSIEEVFQAFASDVSIDFLQELVQLQKAKLATGMQTAVSTMSNVEQKKQVSAKESEKQFELLTANSGKIKVGMFYYNEDKTFSKELIASKQVSGVVAYVDEIHKRGFKEPGLIVTLREKRLPWSSGTLFVEMPNSLNGKENTYLIMKASRAHGKKAEAAEYCANYAYDGIKAGEAFFPSKREWEKIRASMKNNVEAINFSLAKVKGAQLTKDIYWASSEFDEGTAWQQSFSDDYSDRKNSYACVRPMMSF